MAYNQGLSIFYTMFKDLDVELAFEQHVRNKKISAVSNSDDFEVTIKYNGNRLSLFFKDASKLNSYHLVTTRFYFNLYNAADDYVYTSISQKIIDFFKEGITYFYAFGFKILFDIPLELKKELLLRLIEVTVFNEDITKELLLSGDLLNYLVKNFEYISEVGFLKFVVEQYNKKIEEQTTELLENLTSMELPLDWTNLYDDDERTTGVFVESISDGLVKCLNVLGRVDIEYIAKITGYSLKEVIIELGSNIYQNPLYWEESFYKGYETADEYLSGNIYQKLQIALEMNKKYLGYFKKNVEALKLVKPKFVFSNQIYVTLGSPWVPSTVIDQFIDELFGVSGYGRCYGPHAREELKIIHNEENGSWEIPYKSRYYNYNVAVNRTYGTKEINALHIIERTLNMRTIQITKAVKSGKSEKRTVDHEATTLAIEKQKLLIEKFQSWVWQDKERKKLLTSIYEQKYCSNVLRRYNGSFLEFKGMNDEINLYEYQKNSVARILFSPNTLLAHEVGAGKTYVMVAAGMELRRIGISKKNLYVVPKSLVSQWSHMFKYIYPNANILTVTTSMFNVNKMFETLKLIKNGDYDAVIMAYSSFDRIPVSKTYLLEIIKEKLNKLNERKSKKKQTAETKEKIKELQDEIVELETKYINNPDVVYFDELGINTLFVDEAHNYKNLNIESKIMNINGIRSSGSKKCDEMLLKVRLVQKNNNGRGIVFATGTPITNSLSDIYVMQQYLQSGELAMLNLQTFDSWVGMFVEKETTLEVDVDTTNFRMATRFSNYHNMPELSNILANIIDFYSVEDSDEIPKMNGYVDVTIPQTNEFKRYLEEISKRADDIRGGKVKRKDDNFLKLTTDGKKAALDLRLVKPKMQFYLQSKIAYCADIILKLYIDYYKEKYAQLVFCDISTPQDKFNIYDDLKDLLVSYGVKEEEIAFIHDATTDSRRDKLFESVRKGKIRILIGSTFKLGTGVNVQDKLIALHHLDIPWRPSDIIQREGRIIRQGNENEEVFIYRYITEGSFDAYSWQIIENKQKMINALLKGCMTERMCEEVEQTILNYAEIKALAIGNPLLKKRVETANNLNRNRMLQKKYIENRNQMEIELSDIPNRIEILDEKIHGCEVDIKRYEDNKIEFDEEMRKELRSVVYNAIIENELSTEEVYVCDYQGFKLIIPPNIVRDQAYLYVEGYTKYHVDMGGKELGVVVRLDNFFERLTKMKSDYEETKSRLIAKQKALILELEKDNPYGNIIEQLEEELKELDEVLGVDKK